MPQQLKRILLTCIAVILPVLMVACNIDEQKLAPVLNQMLSDKELIESFVHDIKKSYQPGDAPYEELRSLYADARAAQQAYLTAIQMAADTSNANTTLAPIIDHTQQRATAFVSRGVAVLAPGSRAVIPTDLVKCPDLHVDLTRLPNKYRSIAIEEVQRQVRWRPWDDI